MGQVESMSDLSDNLLNTLRVALVFPVNISFTLLGLVANVLNMVVLARLGVTNSMSVGVFSLSFTDFLVTFLQLLMYVFYVLGRAFPDHELDLAAIGSFGVGWLRYVCFFISSWITTFISIEKCVCVVQPFKVRQIFTKSRCLVAVLLTYLVHIAFIAPIYAVQRLEWASMLHGNESSPSARRVFTFVYSERFVAVETIINNIYAVGLAVTSQWLLILCTVWMTFSLKASSRIRHRKDSHTLVSGQRKFFESSASSLSSRERKLIRVALGLGIVLTLSNIPRYAVVAAYYGIAGMSQGAYKNLSDFMWDITDFFSIINCSSNFLVYWMLNVNFRKTFRCMFFDYK